MTARPVKRALLVGINRYADPRQNLRGCVNDALTMAKIITERAGFLHDDVRLLCDARATAENLRKRLAWLVDGAGPGSTLVFHFSGHGSQVRDRNGDELQDRLDEILCPHDLEWDDPFTDDELREVIAEVSPEVNFTIVLDCCHSGTGTRLFYKEPGEPAAPGLRYLVPPPDIAWRGAAGVALDASVAERGVNMERRGTGVRRFGQALLDQPVVLIAGCRSDQTSADAFLENDYRGALTYSLWKALEAAGYELTHRELVRRAGKWLSDAGFTQVPQLESPAPRRDWPFLGMRKASLVMTMPGAAAPAAAESPSTPPMPTNAPPQSSPARAAFLPPDTAVVFAHGIGDHTAGYSDAWRQGVGPYLGLSDAAYHEVVWDDVFDRARRGPGTLATRDLTFAQAARAVDLEMEIRELLAARESATTSVEALQPPDAVVGRSGVRGAHPAPGPRHPLRWLLRFDEYLGDVVKYLVSEHVRDRVDARLSSVLEPLLAAGRPVLLLTHSWGTVVGHHTLRRLGPGREVALHCTLGSPLWMWPVRRALRFDDRRHACRLWVNVHARGDIIGDRLAGRYAVQCDYTVPSLGESPHGSYFVSGNRAVHEDILAFHASESVGELEPLST